MKDWLLCSKRLLERSLGWESNFKRSAWCNFSYIVGLHLTLLRELKCPYHQTSPSMLFETFWHRSHYDCALILEFNFQSDSECLFDIASSLAGPVLFRMFCSALDTSLGGCWCEVRKQGEPRSEEARTHAQSLELQGRGDLCRVVLDSISSCLECSGSSLQVCTFSQLMNLQNFVVESWLLQTICLLVYIIFSSMYVCGRSLK